MKTVYWLPTGYGEVFFSEEGKPLKAWHENDDRRTEYLDGLLKGLGFVIEKVPDNKLKEFRRKAKRNFPGIG